MNDEDSPLLIGLPAPDWHIVLQAASSSKVARGGFFLHRGDAAHCIYLLTAGRAKLIQVTAEGQEVLIRFVGPSEPFGAIAVQPHAIYPISVQAVEDCQALVWDRETFVRLMDRYPTLARNVSQVLMERVRELQDRVRELATQRVERRLARALVRLAQQLGQKVDRSVVIPLSLSREDLAHMTGTTIYTVSRILSQWEQAGIVDVGRSRTVIHSPHRLIAISEDFTTTADSPAPDLLP